MNQIDHVKEALGAVRREAASTGTVANGAPSPVLITAAPAPAPEAAVESPSGVINPAQLDKPAFLMNVPLSFATDVANNPWMEDLPEQERKPNFNTALRQFLQVYQFLAAESVVYLLPAPGNCRLQDLVFTANLGIVLTHVPTPGVAVVSNFTSAPRVLEANAGSPFFERLGYVTRTSPHKFEGEAELKHLHDNVYAGGYGIRSDIRTYEWMQDSFDMKVIPLKETEPYLYHLDCTVFPLTREHTLVCTSLYTKEEVQELERYTNIVDVSVEQAFSGICNSVRLSNIILNASNIHELRAGTEDYIAERDKNRRLEDIATDLGFEPVFFNLSEYLKAGALLSCMVMHLNRHSYEFALV